MKKFWSFLKSKSFFKNLGLALLVVVVLFWIAFKWLDGYTRHGETIKVPDFEGVKISDLDNFIKDKKLRYLVIDSIYDASKNAKKGVVVRQDPEKGKEVKEDRTIYLYVTSVLPPMVSMPNLRDKSLRQAQAIMETYGLKQGKISFRADQCANCVLEQKAKGKKIEAGTMIEKNTVIDLVVGKGLEDAFTAVPSLYGMSRAEAQAALGEVGLNEGALTFEGTDSSRARVYRQYPPPSKDNVVNVGRSVDLWFTTNKDKVPTGADTTGHD